MARGGGEGLGRLEGGKGGGDEGWEGVNGVWLGEEVEVEEGEGVGGKGVWLGERVWLGEGVEVEEGKVEGRGWERASVRRGGSCG